MKITPDSTILVRAFDDSGGLARQLLFTILDGNHILVLSGEILAETSRVLRYPRMRARHGIVRQPNLRLGHVPACRRDRGPTGPNVDRADSGPQ